MVTEDQNDVINFLAAPSTYGTPTVERIDTHTAVVFLAGERGYKLKRAVRFDYLDFSTSERRRAMCDSEVRLNRRTRRTSTVAWCPSLVNRGVHSHLVDQAHPSIGWSR